ncbi:hypothetical protein L210DRAFT_3710700 [Boletus edulis BED1]|uniref:Uncharacterized protein n=1 Tax=Boletus edulis BED1 TaxID=1328754 RepID=A0AAD4G4Y9_BOLED|nr:hypothetical protein L210DRAFT_3710700 [Boletus edulis BED1]
MQLKALCLYLTGLLTFFIASSVQAGPVALAHGDSAATSGRYIDDRGILEGRQEKGLEEVDAEDNDTITRGKWTKGHPRRRYTVMSDHRDSMEVEEGTVRSRVPGILKICFTGGDEKHDRREA